MNVAPEGDDVEAANSETLNLLEQTKAEEELLKNSSIPDATDGNDDPPSIPPNSYDDSNTSSEENGGDDLDTDYADNNEWKPLLEYRREAISVNNKHQNMLLRERIATTSIALVCIQVFVANVFFLIYMLTNLQSINPNVMIAWLSASVVEVIGIMLVVARSLFKPNRKFSDGSSTTK